MRDKLIRLLALQLLLAPAVHAQQLTGRTVEDSSRNPVRNAELVVLTASGTEVARLVTDSSGGFVARLPSAGRYSLRVQHVAYVAYRSPMLEVAAGESMTLEIRLGTNVIPVEPVIVVGRSSASSRLAGFRERTRSKGRGSFVTRAEIDRRPGAAVTDLLRTTPGVQVLPVRRGVDSVPVQMVTMRGSTGLCYPALFLDGALIQQDPRYPLDDLLHPEVLEGVEIYPSGVSVPIEYLAGASSSSCGAVLFWTRAAEPTAGRTGWKRIVIGVGTLVGILALTVSM